MGLRVIFCPEGVGDRGLVWTGCRRPGCKIRPQGYFISRQLAASVLEKLVKGSRPHVFGGRKHDASDAGVIIAEHLPEVVLSMVFGWLNGVGGLLAPGGANQ